MMGGETVLADKSNKRKKQLREGKEIKWEEKTKKKLNDLIHFTFFLLCFIQNENHVCFYIPLKNNQQLRMSD